MKIKRVLAFTAALTLMFSAYCQPVFAEEAAVVSSGTIEDADDPENKIAWSLDDKGTLTISGNGAPYFPDWEAAILTHKVKSVVVESGITALPNMAFACCTELTSVQLPDTLTSIAGGAFQYCSGLTDFTVPDSVTSMEYGIFSNCENLKNVTIGSSVETMDADIFDRCYSLRTITFKNPKCKISESSAFDENILTIRGYKGSTAEELAKEYYQKFEAIDSDYTADYTDFSKRYTIMGKTEDNVLWQISGNKYLVINGERSADGVIKDAPWLAAKDHFEKISSLLNITSISEGAFRGCSNLKGVLSADEFTSIGAMAFADCPKLEQFYFPDSLTSIGAGAFKNCPSLIDVYIPDSVTEIGKDAFDSTAVIYGSKGTAAEKYAKDNGLEFIEPSEPVPDTYEVVINFNLTPGDANCDKNVDMSDAVLIMQSLSNPSKYKLTEQGRKNADFGGDGITSGDALTIQKMLLKLD